jgi:hypothetical protein
MDDDTFDALSSALMHPLDPCTAGRLASCSRALLQRLKAKLTDLRQENRRARSLCAKAGTTSAALRDAKRLVWGQRDLNDEDAGTFASLARAGHLERVKYLGLPQNRISDSGVQALALALSAGSMRRLQVLDLSGNRIGEGGRAALGLALEQPGALPSLVSLSLVNNHRNLPLSEALQASLSRQVGHAMQRKRLVHVKGLCPEQGRAPSDKQHLIGLPRHARE